ncbi:MAG: hypothetical protein UT55_C0068G0003 [Candidatus Peregrinibacteria bacterium GW2011_GWE2_39_6]|nr:MAG: hypothetical protein UT36_C0006G0045 [Candidatus Peregrinibacteria bacterium GW2011_GWF2_39_17]KKR24222.1 MAG: hypothetical protein UT55_C0068G0003 [Candidatus Peregrinibacteria bacterium GW2011_GWE2_39_6]HCW32793.1 hypothetical protein [Candidatus Peregrinibacteria bacterium]
MSLFLKKLIIYFSAKIIFIFVILNIFNFGLSAYALNSDKTCDSINLTADEKLECLLGTEKELIQGSPQGKATNTNLPSGDLMGDFLPFFINTALAVAGTLIFTAFLYAGYLLVFVNNNEEQIEKAKKILIYSLIGAAVMAISYAVIYGIAHLDLD